jgi:hypothetical protein
LRWRSNAQSNDRSVAAIAVVIAPGRLASENLESSIKAIADLDTMTARPGKARKTASADASLA